MNLKSHKQPNLNTAQTPDANFRSTQGTFKVQRYVKHLLSPSGLEQSGCCRVPVQPCWRRTHGTWRCPLLAGLWHCSSSRKLQSPQSASWNLLQSRVERNECALHDTAVSYPPELCIRQHVCIYLGLFMISEITDRRNMIPVWETVFFPLNSSWLVHISNTRWCCCPTNNDW